ncbi:hypothetical protein RSAG8_01580, partial [Rhizoctonia solani AG-8 WAC10335]
MNFDFTDKTETTIAAAAQSAKDHANAQVTPFHLANALLNEGSGVADNAAGTSLFASVISKAGGDIAAVNRAIQKQLVRLPSQDPPPDETTLSSATLKVLRDAQSIQKDMHDSFIAQDHLILALIKDSGITALLKEANITPAAIKTAAQATRGNRRVDSKNAEQGFDALTKYAVDLTALAEEGKIDPVIGRDNEIRRVVRILCRRTKNNPVLIGEPGVGKTAIAEGLAQRIVKRDVPASLLGRVFSLDMGALMAGAKYKGEYEERIKSVLSEVRRVFSLDMGALMAGAKYKGEYEERIKSVLSEVEKKGEEGVGIILFIDELHLIMAGSGNSSGGMDAANLLKPLLARGKLRCIGATTYAEYRQYIEKDAALERRFAQVIVNEPSVPDTISILRGIRERYEVHHGVRILDPALIQAAVLAHRYLTSRRLPDSAIDLVDEACASVRVTRETSPEEIDKLERKKLELEIEIHALEREKDAASKERLGLAKKAIADLEDRLQPMKAAYENEKRRGDELNNIRKKIDELRAKADDAERRYDVTTASDLRYYAIPDLQKRLEALERQKESEEPSANDSVTPEAIAEIVSRWTSIPVTRLMSTEREKLLRMEKILSWLVIDEIEKAAREFVTLFLQVLDDGRLTDGQGRVVDFRNTVVIMTSNLGAAYLNDMGEGPVKPEARTLVTGAIQAHFPPEFINRIDEVIIFRSLSRGNVMKIVDIRLKELEERIADRKLKINLEPDAKHYLGSIGYSPIYGARPLNRVIQQELLNPLSVLLLEERILDGETVNVKFDGPHNRLYIVPNHEGSGTQYDDMMEYDDDIEIEEMD